MDLKEARSKCVKQCETDYVRLTAQKRAGGVETLRVCREKCPSAK